MSHKSEESTIAGVALKCHHCGHAVFRSQAVQLHTGASSSFAREWATEGASCKVCDRCGFIHWFLARNH